MLGFIAPAYTVQAVSPPDVRLYLDSRYSKCAAAPTKPKTLALSSSGAVAMIFPPDYVYGDGARDVFIVRRDGTRVRLTIPPSELLARSFHIHETRNGRPIFQDIYFQSVRVADDGTPIATVGSHFSGAYSGLETAAFRWNGVQWRKIPPRDVVQPNAPSGDEAVDMGIAAADTPDRAAFNGVYGRKWHPDFDRRNDPTYLRNVAEFMDGRRVVSLGIGTATAIRGTTVVGFRGGTNPFGPSCEMPRKTYAMKWTNGRPHRLGSGVAYDVNGSGQTVGDDEAYLGHAGRPVLWRDGRTFVLDRKAGSAYAISGDGTIVGRVDDAAFVTDGLHPMSHVKMLDGLISNHAWHIHAAYGIARTGRILAVASRGSGLPQIVVLDPR